MLAISLVDSADGNTHYGILVCENNEISVSKLRDKMLEILDKYKAESWDM